MKLLSWTVNLRHLPHGATVRVGDERFASVSLNGAVYEGSAVCERVTRGSDGIAWAHFRLAVATVHTSESPPWEYVAEWGPWRHPVGGWNMAETDEAPQRPATPRRESFADWQARTARLIAERQGGGQ